jgi:hypothetical protein
MAAWRLTAFSPLVFPPFFLRSIGGIMRGEAPITRNLDGPGRGVQIGFVGDRSTLRGGHLDEAVLI